MKRSFLCVALLVAAIRVAAHETSDMHQHAVPTARPLKVQVEKRGPIRAPARTQVNGPVSGQGFWKFVAVTNAVPIPEEALTNVVRAHSTLIVDAERDIVYWALKRTGWIGFSNKLQSSWVVDADTNFHRFNIHGADILPRKGQLPLVGAADNEAYKVYLMDTTFQNPKTLLVSKSGPYATNETFRPTDVAFIDEDRLFITDGYARNFFMPARTKPFVYENKFFGGRKMSQTAHGITYDSKKKSLLVSARPEGQVQRWSVAKEEYLEIDGLPTGTLLCDVDLWGDYALAACLEGPNKTPGPLMVLNLKKKTIVSVIKPKEELGYEFAQHMHDAAWYLPRNGQRTEVYIIFTAWNPGGIGALKLVNQPD
jgi:hypothetical protein